MGFAIPFPAMSGADPCTGSNIDGKSPSGLIFAEGAIAIDPATGMAPIALEGEGFGNMIDDSKIEIEGVELTDSLEVIAEKLELDPSLVTSRAIAETLSSVASDVSNEISSGPTSDPGYQAIDPNTGEAPKP